MIGKNPINFFVDMFAFIFRCSTSLAFIFAARAHHLSKHPKSLSFAGFGLAAMTRVS